MASWDKLEKQGPFYYKDHPQLGKIRGLDPWAVDNGIHLIRMEQDAAEGIMMVDESNQQQYGTVHGGMLVAFADTIGGHSLVAHGRMCVVSVEQRNDRDELVTTALFTFAVVKKMDPILLPPKHPSLTF